MANAMVDLEELCALLSRSWPDAGLAPGSASTADDLSAKSSDTNDRGASTTAGADDFDRFGLMPLDHPQHVEDDPGTTWQVMNGVMQVPLPYATGIPLDKPITHAKPSLTHFSGEASRRVTAMAGFSDDAMRVLTTCEQILAGGGHATDPEGLLEEIAQLKKRYCRPSTGSEDEPTRKSICRHRRYSLSSDARNVLKAWVDEHIEDPYPSIEEKQVLAQKGNLSIKQVNDWFTNWRKRHWEDEMIALRK